MSKVIEVGDNVINEADNIQAKYLGLGTFYSKEYVEMQAVIEIIRGGETKLGMVQAIEAFQAKNRNIQIAMIDIKDRRAFTAITTDKFILNYKKDISNEREPDTEKDN